jgi:hypothetical protein
MPLEEIRRWGKQAIDAKKAVDADEGPGDHNWVIDTTMWANRVLRLVAQAIGGDDPVLLAYGAQREQRKEGGTMRVEDFTFEQRPLNALPDSNLSQWLADFNGDDQWYEDSPVTQAAVVLGNHIIIWKDKPLTDEDKRDAVAEYEETMEADAARDEDGCFAEYPDGEYTAQSKWQREGF